MISDMKMAKADLQFAIDQMRKDKMIYGVEALVVSFLCVLSAVFLPEALYRIVFSSGKVQSNLDLLNWVPTASYVIAAAFSLFVLVSNGMRLKSIRMMEMALKSAKK